MTENEFIGEKEYIVISDYGDEVYDICYVDKDNDLADDGIYHADGIKNALTLAKELAEKENISENCIFILQEPYQFQGDKDFNCEQIVKFDSLIKKNSLGKVFKSTKVYNEITKEYVFIYE